MNRQAEPAKMSAGGGSAYSRQLDGLRGLAILLVFLHHTGWKLPYEWDWGQMGLRIFFLLTGYLITISLWKLMDRVKVHEMSHRRELLVYHLRRLARLLPAFYAALLLGYVLGLDDVLEPIWWHLAFFTNFRIALQGFWMGPTANFWSLAMQEQFYLVWPVFVLWTPRKYFPAMLGVLVFSGYAYRVGCMIFGVPELWRWLMLPGSIDTFALGALIAWWKTERGLPEIPQRGWQTIAIWIAFSACWAANRIIRYSDEIPWVDALPELFEGVCAGWLLICCVQNQGGWLGTFFSMGWLRYLGRISYGIFAYHLILLWYFESHFAKFAIGPTRLPFLWSLGMFFITLLVASVSYRYLEMPVVRLAKKGQKRAEE